MTPADTGPPDDGDEEDVLWSGLGNLALAVFTHATLAFFVYALCRAIGCPPADAALWVVSAQTAEYAIVQADILPTDEPLTVVEA